MIVKYSIKNINTSRSIIPQNFETLLEYTNFYIDFNYLDNVEKFGLNNVPAVGGGSGSGSDTKNIFSSNTDDYDTGFSKTLFFNANHSFTYYIRHIPTNTIILIGSFD